MPRLLGAIRRASRLPLPTALPRQAAVPRIAAQVTPRPSTYLQHGVASFAPSLRGSITSSRPSIASRATSQVSAALLGGSNPSASLPPPSLQSVRLTTYGAEYQPNQLKRKRTHGFLARIKSRHGRKILARRRAKGKRFLSH